jgi:Na+/H+ antiporter NhaC
MILVLAWSISAVCKEIHTGGYVYTVTRGILFPQIVPALSFVVAGAIAFATGTSYGTMGILIPILLPLTYQLAFSSGAEPELCNQLGLATLAAILGGAVFGDHCSPISDTTVLSSMASGADHIDHVRTQLPYALLVAGVGFPCYVVVGLGVSPFLILPVGAALLVGVFALLSRAG